MLKRIYVDNYLCFVDFELIPGQREVLAGDHGTGRSSLFRLMEQIRSFVLSSPDDGGGRVWDAFSYESCTGWQNRPVQTFEVELEQDGERYLYRLQVAHANNDEFQTRVVKEELHHGGQVVFSFSDGEGRLPAADGSFTKLYKTDGERSALAMALSTTNDERLRGFRDWWMDTLWQAQVGSYDLRDLDGESARPGTHFYNFAPWVRYITRTNPQQLANLNAELATILVGFERLEVGEGQWGERLQVAYSGPNGDASASYNYDNVSHAESVIIQLYALIHLAEPPFGVLWVSAPRAAIRAAVLRRWLERALQRANELSIQLLVNVTDPEVYGDVPGAGVTLFERPKGGRVQMKSGLREPSRE